MLYICNMSTLPFLKGHLETIVLRLLDQHGKMYGYEITQKVKISSAGAFQITEGALYPVLHRLEAAGVLEVHHEAVNGRVRKYYALSEQGRQEAVNQLSNLRENLAQLTQLLNLQLKID